MNQPSAFREMIERYNRELMQAYRQAQPTAALIASPAANEAEEAPADSAAARAEAPPTPAEDTRPRYPLFSAETASPEELTPTPSPAPDEVGYLQVWVTTASRAVPVAGAQVTVRAENAASGEADTVRYMGVTDSSGRSVTVPLAAADRQLSLTPDSARRPYTPYTVEVYAPGYYRVVNRHLPLYSGVRAVQPVWLVPLPENVADGRQEFDETAPALEQKEENT